MPGPQLSNKYTLIPYKPEVFYFFFSFFKK